jgi:hypothetical protein
MFADDIVVTFSWPIAAKNGETRARQRVRSNRPASLLTIKEQNDDRSGADHCCGVDVRNRRNNAADRKTFQGGNHLHEIR